MTRKRLILLLLASLFASPTVHAAIELIAVGSMSGIYEDAATETAGPLENGKGLGDGSTAAVKHLYHIDLAGAQEVSGARKLAGKAVDKTLFLDVVAVLNAHGITSDKIPAKLVVTSTAVRQNAS